MPRQRKRCPDDETSTTRRSAMKTSPYAFILFAGSLVLALAGLPRDGHAEDNPALWKVQVSGNYADVLAGVKRGIEAGQFQLTGEENLSKGIETNKDIFPEGKWNTIGFDRVTAVHFCSIVFNQEVFNMNMDWSILCPFKVVLYTMKASPNTVTVEFVRPTYLLAQDPHPGAHEVGKKIEDRIVAAIRDGLAN
jgi:uncharacterized protein (DUF302 family)